MKDMFFVSGTPPAGYEEFIVEGINELRKVKKVKGVMLLAFVDDERVPEKDGIITGYYGMSLRDKQIAAASISEDIIDAVVKANFERYMEEYTDGQIQDADSETGDEM